MPNEPTFHTVYKSMNKPLTIAGAERSLFFLALVMGSATFNFFGSLVGGVLMFAVLFVAARWATASEKNNAGFAVEASADGTAFRRLGWVEGQGGSSRTL